VINSIIIASNEDGSHVSQTSVVRMGAVCVYGKIDYVYLKE